MDTDLLIVFRTVAELGSFTAAAHALGYTQSAISRQVAALETEFGTPLFDRLPRGTRLTEAGHCLLPHAELVDGRLARARDDLAALRDMTVGHVRVGAFPTANAALVPRAAAAFTAVHPAVKLSLDEGLVRDLVERLRADDLDTAIVTATVPGILDGLELRHVMDDRMFVAVHPGHQYSARAMVRLSELADEDWIAGHSRPDLTLLATRPDFRPRIRYVIGEWVAKQGFVAAGLGLTLIPELAAASVRPDIVLVPLHADDLLPRQIFAATVPHRTPPASLAAYMTCLDQAAAGISGHKDGAAMRTGARTPGRARNA